MNHSQLCDYIERLDTEQARAWERHKNESLRILLKCLQNLDSASILSSDLKHDSKMILLDAQLAISSLYLQEPCLSS